MSNFITLSKSDSQATHAARILQVSAQVKSLRQAIDALVAESFQMFEQSPKPQFELVMTKYGVSTVEEAQMIFDMLNGTKLALDGKGQNANAVDLATRIG